MKQDNPRLALTLNELSLDHKDFEFDSDEESLSECFARGINLGGSAREILSWLLEVESYASGISDSAEFMIKQIRAVTHLPDPELREQVAKLKLRMKTIASTTKTVDRRVATQLKADLLEILELLISVQGDEK